MATIPMITVTWTAKGVETVCDMIAALSQERDQLRASLAYVQGISTEQAERIRVLERMLVEEAVGLT